MRNNRLAGRFLGSILGCAVGDALGAPFEGAQPASIRLDPRGSIAFRKIRGYPLGQYTDDTQMTLAIIKAVCRTNRVDGEVIAREFTALWQTGEIVGAGASCTEAVYNMLHHGMNWESAGTAEGRAGNGAAMRAAPIGLWNHARPEHIERDARISSIITHKDPRSTAGAIAVARAVQSCANADDLAPEEFLHGISDNVRATSAIFAKSIDGLVDLIGLEPAEALPFIYAAGEPDVGPRRPGWVTAYVIPTVLCALYFFLRTARQFIHSVAGAISAGGDTDTVAAITGAISGAYNGISSIPQNLVRDLKDSKDILALAEQFHDIATSRV